MYMPLRVRETRCTSLDGFGREITPKQISALIQAYSASCGDLRCEKKNYIANVNFLLSS